MPYAQQDSPSNKTLSIIVTAHNMQDYILNCMNSIISAVGESISSCEIILINDASEDKTACIMSEFSKNRNITYLETDFKNIGKVRNYGVSLCSGDYITMVDGDDIVFENSLPKIISFLQEASPDIYITPLYEWRGGVMQKRNTMCEWKKPIHLTCNKAIKLFLIHKKFQAHFIGKMIRRGLFCGSEFPDYICYEDSALFPEILSKAKNIFFDENPFYLYRKNPDSLSNRIYAEKISHLASSITIMDNSFGEKYRHLTACHAIELLHKHRRLISPQSFCDINKILTHTSKFKLLLSPSVRLSFKRKYLSLFTGNK